MFKFNTNENKLVIDNQSKNDEQYQEVNNISITKMKTQSNFLNELPYCDINNVYQIDLTNKNNREPDITYEVICSKNEFVFAIQDFYLKLLDDKDLNFEDLAANVSPRTQLFEHIPISQGYKVYIKKKEINYLLNFDSDDLDYLSKSMESSQNRLKYLLSGGYNNKFLIVVGKFKNLYKDVHDDLGLTRLQINGDIVEKKETIEPGNKPPIIIVHGLASRIGSSYFHLINHLENNYTVYGFDYLTINQSINVSSKLLEIEIKHLSKKYNNDDVLVIAHSMGGLVSRSSMIINNSKIKYIIMAGTPNNGSRLPSVPLISRFILVLSNIIQIKEKDFQDLVRSRNIDGLHDLTNKTKFIDKLNSRDNYHKKYFTLAGAKYFSSSDGLVSINNMVIINKISMLYIKEKQWSHINYFNSGNFEIPLNQALQYSI
ncbi:esterase/lipase family protein [Fictibacillus sp. FJAT-27399]|uniref:esterase/lipase family protein n=1 Tax=Fictibacillus sp. FJAT-27399 TaxID=1729689 RepID=UPI000785033F|nr:alpha/beta fold hydrolase [Fictibacillus sp. FJAT-27399]